MLFRKLFLSGIILLVLLISSFVSVGFSSVLWTKSYTKAGEQAPHPGPPSSTSYSGPLLHLKDIRFIVEEQSKKIEITLRNSGNHFAIIDEVHIGLTSENLERQEHGPFVVLENSTRTITILNYNFEDGRTYYFKLGTYNGPNIPFSRECSSITGSLIETKQSEPFPLTAFTAIILTIIGVSVTLLIYFKKLRQ